MIDYELPEAYLPYSEECEQSVIGGILIDNSRAVDVCEMLSVQDFYLKQHQLIFGAIVFCVENNRPSDVVTVIECLESQNKSEEAGGCGYMAELAQSTPSAANVMAYAQAVKGKSREREGLDIATQMKDIIQFGEGTSEENINDAYSLFTQLDMQDANEITFEDMQKNAIATLEERAESDGSLSGVSTGFKNLDERFNGLQKTDLIILAARPSIGKTTMALNIVQKVAKTKPVVVFSMEQSGEQLVEKLWSTHGINTKNIKSGILSDSEWGVMNTAVIKTKALNLEIDDRPSLKPQQVRAKCLRLKRKFGELGLVMVDYLQLMVTNGKGGRTEEVSEVSRSLKALAKELGCPVLALSQLNRGLETRNNKRPIMSDLRESGAIEQDADIIMLLYRDDFYANQEDRQSTHPGILEINSGKFRAGETGRDYLRSMLQYSKFEDIVGGYEPEPEQPEQTPRQRRPPPEHKSQF